jgi:hypothetical protein
MMNIPYKEIVIRSVIAGFSLVALFVLIFSLVFQPPETQEEKFKVVDKYQGCDVVQYTDPWGAKYHYFLHCK